jgi:hypothetical protein
MHVCFQPVQPWHLAGTLSIILGVADADERLPSRTGRNFHRCHDVALTPAAGMVVRLDLQSALISIAGEQ